MNGAPVVATLLMAVGAVLWCVNQICPSGPAVIQPGWLGFGISNSSNAMAGAGGGGSALRAIDPAAPVGAASLALRQPGIKQVRSANEPSAIGASALDFKFTRG